MLSTGPFSSLMNYFPLFFSDVFLHAWFIFSCVLTVGSVCFVVFDSPLAYLDPVSCNMTYMFVQLFKDALNEYAYAAELAGMKWELSNTKYGMIVSIPVATNAVKVQYHDERNPIY
jgi:hypothetical protein